MRLNAQTSGELREPVRPSFDKRGERSVWKRVLSWLDLKASPYAYVAPFFLLFVAFGLFPLGYTAWVSLHDVTLQNVDEMTWVGLENYERLLGGEPFRNALLNTVTIGLISTVPQLLFALGLAHLLNYELRARTFFRISILIPFLTSVAAATIIFAQLFGRDFGLINYVLGVFGISPVDWEGGRWSSQIAISTIVMWRWTGYNALIYLAAMQSIPRELYDAAAVDGAGRWHQFRHVTIPGIRPTIVFTVIVSTIGATQLFAEPLLFGGAGGFEGGANHQYQTLGLLLYEQGWHSFQLGRAASTAWTMFLIIILAVALNAFLAAHGWSPFGARRKEKAR